MTQDDLALFKSEGIAYLKLDRMPPELVKAMGSMPGDNEREQLEYFQLKVDEWIRNEIFIYDINTGRYDRELRHAQE